MLSPPAELVGIVLVLGALIVFIVFAKQLGFDTGRGGGDGGGGDGGDGGC